MINKSINVTIVFVFIITSSIFSQEQTDFKIDLPQLTFEQKLSHAGGNLTGFVVSGIALAKEMGKSSKEYGEIVGKLFAPEWESVKGKGIATYINAMYKNWQADKDFKIEILKESKTSIEGKMTVWFDSNAIFWSEKSGVTLEEYVSFFNEIYKAITEYLGFKYKEKFEAGWITFTITEKI